MENYVIIEKEGKNSGEGTYGVVYKAKDKRTGGFVVLKKIKNGISAEGIPSTSLREIASLKLLSHVNIVGLKDILSKDGKLILVFEFIQSDLKKYMQAHLGMLPSETIQSFARQLITGVDHCHSNGIMHRDLKPQNILISADGKLKVADFGLARAFVPPIRQLTHEVVTLWYRPPEILLGSKTYALPIDMWAVGCIITELVNKRPLFPGDSEVDQLFKIFRKLGTPSEADWPGVSYLPDWNDDFPEWPTLKVRSFIQNDVEKQNIELIDIIERCLWLDPKQRLSANDALRHPYITQGVDHS